MMAHAKSRQHPTGSILQATGSRTTAPEMVQKAERERLSEKGGRGLGEIRKTPWYKGDRGPKKNVKKKGNA